MKIVILHDELAADARPDELDTLVQADCVARALGELGHTATRQGFSMNLEQTAKSLREAQPDCVFNLVESAGGVGRLVYLATALLDSMGLPYTGNRTEPMFLTSSKTLCKQTLAASSIPTAPWFTLASLAHDAGPVAGRYIVKSVWEEASVGLEDDSVQEYASAEQLKGELLARRGRLGGEAFAEAYIEGREFNLSVISGAGRDSRTSEDGPRVLPPAEIQFIDFAAGKPKIVGYSAKWRDDTHEFHHTPRTFDFVDADRALLAELIGIAKRCWLTLGLNGYARVDFRVDAAGRPFVLEVNANPCLSPDAGFMAAVGRAGMTFNDIVRQLIQEATESA